MSLILKSTIANGIISKNQVLSCVQCGTDCLNRYSIEDTKNAHFKPFCCSACELLHEIQIHAWKPNQSLSFNKNASDYAFMDNEEYKNYYRTDDHSFIFYIEGLQCASCVHLIEKLPDFYSEVKSCELNFGLSTLKVYASDDLKMSQLMAVIVELGYHATPLTKDDNVVEKFKKENREQLKKIAVAGACAGNIMLFVVPVYAGLTGTYATVFNWIGFFLFLPILFYSATGFYIGAINSLKYQVINVDLPITLALFAGFFFSTYNLINGQGEIYFDSTASFMFLILSTRFFVKRVQQKSLSESSLSHYIPIQSVKIKLPTGEYQIKPSHKISKGDILLIEPNQIIPADGTIYSISADIDMSLLNGESLPQTMPHGMKAFAGTKALNKSFELLVDATEGETEIGHIIKKLEKESLQKTTFITLSDKISQWLIAIVFLLAILFFVFYGATENYQEAFNRSLALIVLACPCALAFGTPLTYAMALRKSRQLGILIKNGNVFEKVLKIKNIFFDKTGTLTSGQLSLIQQFPNEIHNDWKEIILGLEINSTHPLAFAFRKSWKEITPKNIKNLKEKLGQGVFGEYENQNYSIESTHKREESGLMVVAFKRENHVLGYFYFSDELHHDTQRVIQYLKEKNYQIGILSGDRKFIVQKIANDVSIENSMVFSELKPLEKQDLILNNKDVCMIGDGANDALALNSALVGIAVKGSVSISLNSCDVYFTRSGLSSLIDLISISKSAHRTLKRNLFFALAYNSIGGILALCGLINPLIAAILMPLSSLLIILSTIWGIK